MTAVLSEILETRVFTEPRERNDAGRAVTLFADDDLGAPLSCVSGL